MQITHTNNKTIIRLRAERDEAIKRAEESGYAAGIRWIESADYIELARLVEFFREYHDQPNPEPLTPLIIAAAVFGETTCTRGDVEGFWSVVEAGAVLSMPELVAEAYCNRFVDGLTEAFEEAFAE